MTEDEIVGWYHRFDGHKLEQTSGDCEPLGSQVCCHPWGQKESDKTEPLSSNNMSRKVPRSPRIGSSI